MLLKGKKKFKKAFFTSVFPGRQLPGLTAEKEYCVEWKKVIFQGGSIIFSQKNSHEPLPSTSPVESFEFLLETLTSAEAQKGSSTP